MERISFTRGTESEFEAFVREARSRALERSGSVLFHVFNDTADRSITEKAVRVIEEIMPEASCVGCSTSGNICEGVFVSGELPNLSAFCDIYESSDTRIEVHQLPLRNEVLKQTEAEFKRILQERPWVKAVEVLTTIIDVDMYEFCSQIGKVRDDVLFFGGGALCTETVDMYTGLPYVFSSGGQASGHAIVFVLYGGNDYNVEVKAVTGWKPLGRQLEITRAEGPVLYELDGMPAYELYRHYLSIENDEVFSSNSLIFPFFVERDGYPVLKAPVRVNDDMSLALTSDVGRNDKWCRLAYGDPAIILQSIQETVNSMRAFCPQALFTFSCAGRFTYWGSEFISRETESFQEVAPANGFYTGSEFARHNGTVLQHNLTLVVVGVREGEAPEGHFSSVQMDATGFDREMAIVSKLAALVGVTSAELEEAYGRMKVIATTDGLTGLLNRKEIESRIVETLEQARDIVESDSALRPCVIMFDIDFFKRVNDAYGHKAGDDVLRGTGELLKRRVEGGGKGYSGRWGGEEFMVLLPKATIEDAREFAEAIRLEFREIDYALSGKHTLSAGVAASLMGETTDLLCQRVDKALYAAKKNGKDTVVVA